MCLVTIVELSSVGIFSNDPKFHAGIVQTPNKALGQRNTSSELHHTFITCNMVLCALFKF